MVDSRLRRRMQLALSWRAAAQRQHEITERRGIEGAHRVDLATHVPRAAHAATAAVSKLRVRARKDLAREAAALRRAHCARKRLASRADRMAPRRANERGRALARRIDMCQRRVAELNRIATAESAEELGGGLQMPLEAYPAALRKARGNLWQALPPEDRRTLTLGGAGILVAILAVSWVWGWGNAVRFSAYQTAQGRFIHVVCENETPREIVLHAPWYEEAEVVRPGQAYGMDAYVRTGGTKAYRLLPVVDGAWQYEGSPTELAEPIRVPPWMRAEAVLDTSVLPLPAAGGTMLKLVYRRGDGRRLGELILRPVS